MKFAKSTIQRFKKSRVDVGLTNLRCALEICKVHHTTIPKFKGGRCRCKLAVSLNFAKFYLTKIRKNQGWTLALHTLTVCLKFAESTVQRYRNIKRGRWRYKLTVCLKFAKSNIQRYKVSGVDVGVTNVGCNLTFAKSTVQRYKNSRVDVSVTNLIPSSV